MLSINLVSPLFSVEHRARAEIGDFDDFEWSARKYDLLLFLIVTKITYLFILIRIQYPEQNHLWLSIICLVFSNVIPNPSFAGEGIPFKL